MIFFATNLVLAIDVQALLPKPSRSAAVSRVSDTAFLCPLNPGIENAESNGKALIEVTQHVPNALTLTCERRGLAHKT